MKVLFLSAVLAFISFLIVPLSVSAEEAGKLETSSLESPSAEGKKIDEFLSIGLNNSAEGFSGGKIDMTGRSKFFSKEGWKQYEDYITWRKERIKATKEISSPGRLDLKTQKIVEKENGLTEFSAQGVFYYGTGCFFLKSEGFKIDVSFSRPDDPEEILIQKWNVVLNTPDKIPEMRRLRGPAR